MPGVKLKKEKEKTESTIVPTWVTQEHKSWREMHYINLGFVTR